VIFSNLTSLWETSVDRHALGRRGVSAWRYRFTDKVSCSLPDMVWLDTQTHIDWFAQEFGVAASRFRRIWVGADDEVMRPQPRPGGDRPLTVLFYGTFIPLQGIEHIIDAAALVAGENERIRFILCGDGQTHAEMRRRARHLALRNLEFVPRRPPAELARLIGRSDLNLGIFGSGEKTGRVIPNKVFDALACERPVITGDTPAVRECLTDGEHAWLCPTGEPEALARAVLESSEDPAARARVARAGRELFQREFSLDALSRRLPPLIREVLS
jgi:glycosyltransferase involved in cell wall biosynthesis